ncbi:NLR family CARD domain-containing protein 4-like [Asterias amurensis]|uniref:NLR family CARD domain-containing protein 4-like n=1 Tax=Asterias amurensis TaxID=7602 RepID=UPI003AB283C2
MEDVENKTTVASCDAQEQHGGGANNHGDSRHEEQQPLHQMHSQHLQSTQESCQPQQCFVPPSTPTCTCTQPSVIGDINVEGSGNFIFLGPVSGNTFNVCKETGRGDETKAIKHQTRLEQTAADHCETSIKRRYMSTGSFVKGIPWEDDDTKHVKDIYTKLLLETNESLKSYNEIFHLASKEGLPIKRVILNGVAGRGKTTLVDKMAYDWANGASTAMQSYKLVFALKMNALDKTSELIDAIFDQLLDEDTLVNRTDLDSFITKNPDKVLILFDGFDELISRDTTSIGSIFKILNRKIGRECFVVVSTRPSHFDRLITRNLIQKPFASVRVNGFDSESIVKYVKRFFAEDVEKEDGLIQRIKSSNILSDLAKSPMLLLLMCILWREESSLPETMSQLYSQAFLYMFKRKSDVPQEEVSKVIIEIGKIGLRGLLSSSSIMAFPEREFDRTTLDMAITAGILTKQRVIKCLESHNSIQFIHKTFQELCAGKYLNSLLKEATVDFQKTLRHIVCSSVKDPCEFEYLLRFCCGDDEACTNMILESLIERLPNDQRVWKLVLDCYFEGQSGQLPPNKVVQSLITQEMSFQQLNQDCLNSFIWFLDHITIMMTNGGYNYLAKVSKIHIEMCDLPMRFCEGLAKSFTAMTNLTALTLTQCKMTGRKMHCIVSALSKAAKLSRLELSENEMTDDKRNQNAAAWVDQVQFIKNLSVLHLNDCSLTAAVVAAVLSHRCGLTELAVANNEALGGCAKLWCHHLRYMTRLHKLDMSGCLLRGDDLKYVAYSLCELPGFTNLVLKENNTLAIGGHEPALSHLRLLKHLEKLDMSSCSLTGKHVAHISESPNDLPNLVELKLFKNKNLGSCAAVWSSQLRYLEKLQKLFIGGCSLIDVDMVHVAKSLCGLTNLEELQLIGNTSLGACAATWAHSLRHLKRLKILGMRFCSLTGEDMGYVTDSLGFLPMLTVLILDGNMALGNSVDLWSGQLKNLKSLKELEMGKCALTGPDMEHVCQLPNLVELRLPSNPKLGGSASTWASHLSNLENLQKFDLGFCAMTGKDMPCILDAISSCHLPNLIEFKLSSNKDLSGSADLWSVNLKGMTQVKILNFGNCCLTGADMLHMAVSLGQMTNLAELVLYGCTALSGTVESWCHHLKNIKKVDLSGCFLTGGDMTNLIKSCQGFYYSTSVFSYDINT